MRQLSLLLCLAGFSMPPGATGLSPELIKVIPAIVLDSGGSAISIDPAEHIRNPEAPGTVVRITTRIGPELKNIDLALFDTQTPETVANFRHYIDSGAFSSSFVHRLIPGFIFQGGGFRFTGPTTFGIVPVTSPVGNEPGISNIRGTIAMAKIGGDPDSATSQWFINLGDNSANLDGQNGGFTVFGRVIGGGLAVVDEIAALPAYNASGLHPAWTDLPLKNFAEPIAREHFVETEMTIIPSLSFDAISDDPDLVRSVIVNGTLELTPSRERAGSTTVTIIAKDLNGAEFQLETQVTVMASYTSWRKQWEFPSALEENPMADSNSNGWSNLLEFAFGGTPLTAGFPPEKPEMEPGGGLAFGHLRYAHLNYTVWNSEDLKTWTAVWSTTDGFEHAAVHFDSKNETFRKLIIREPEYTRVPSRRFWRVSVDAVEPTDLTPAN